MAPCVSQRVSNRPCGVSVSMAAQDFTDMRTMKLPVVACVRVDEMQVLNGHRGAGVGYNTLSLGLNFVPTGVLIDPPDALMIASRMPVVLVEMFAAGIFASTRMQNLLATPRSFPVIPRSVRNTDVPNSGQAAPATSTAVAGPMSIIVPSKPLRTWTCFPRLNAMPIIDARAKISSVSDGEAALGNSGFGNDV